MLPQTRQASNIWFLFHHASHDVSYAPECIWGYRLHCAQQLNLSGNDLNDRCNVC